MNPRSLTSEAKLETQNGMRNSLKSCHLSSRVDLLVPAVLRYSANPTMPLNPIEVSQIRGFASK